MLVLRILAVVAGLVMVVGTLLSAVKTVVVPRGYVSRLTRRHFRAMRRSVKKPVRITRSA